MNHHQITNIDKTIRELTNRLNVAHTYSTSNNHQNRNDGITYWKGKKIISTKDWNILYQKSSTYTDTYKTTLTSRKPLQYFPDDYNGSISISSIVDEKLKEDIQNWNKDYYELLEFRRNPTLGRMKCSKCLLSGSNDDPIFVGIEKVFARIVINQCNNDNIDINSDLLTYHCNIMNIFSCPFESKKESKLSYIKEDLFALHHISFAIEQAITTFSEITKDNEIIYEVDFENDRVKEIHTNYNGEPESWGWQANVNEQLSKVKPISNIVIRDEQDIYNILTNREKLELLLEEYQKNQLEEQEVCCDKNTLCVPTNPDIDNSNNKKNASATTITEPLASTRKIGQQIQNEQDYSHTGQNRHSKKIEELNREQQILLKDNQEAIIDFLLDNIDSIRVEDCKIYEPIYKCYREKVNCHICNSSSNIICKNCNYSYHSHYNNKEVMLCINHWKQHAIENHIKQLIK